MKRLEEIKELLIIVDMVNGFVKEGALADPYIEHIVPELIRLIKIYKSRQDREVAFIRDAHSKNSIEFKKFPVHCIKGTYESEIIDELKPFSKDALVYEKDSRSTMFAKGFMDDLSKMKSLREVIVTGCCTDLCVIDAAIPLSNYFDQMNSEVQIIVPKNAVETYDAPWHKRDEYSEITFKLMEQEGIKLVKSLGGQR